MDPSISKYLETPVPIPLAERIPMPKIAPDEAYERVARPPHSFLLESVQNGGGKGRYSFIGTDPFMTLKSYGERVEVQWGNKQETLIGNPLIILGQYLKKFSMPRPEGFPPFFGGAVGFLSYDLAHLLEKLPRAPSADPQIADLHFAFVETVIVFDHAEQDLWLIYCPRADRFIHENRLDLYEEGVQKISFIKNRLSQPFSRRGSPPRIHPPPSIHSNFTKDAYIRMVRACKDYIAAGDIYQANLSQRFQLDSTVDPWSLYRSLREINPSPFSAFLTLDDLCLVSASPERLVRLLDGALETRPIAGTAPRGKTPQEDEAIQQALIQNEKERAEHLMLVDLERNDLGRVCEYGSIRVNEFMTLEKYSHVTHIVSNISGRLFPGMNCLDVIPAVFPGGTITGVPKIRCMEIIAELEPVCRGPYTGSIGYISFAGDMDLNIIIRTFILSKDLVTIQAGGGIVADSDPEQEYAETLYKAEALLKTAQVKF